MNKIYIIAEIGVNHDGDFNRALELVSDAKKAGADAVKFQSFSAEKLVDIHTEKADYQKRNDKHPTQYEMLKGLELKNNEFLAIKKYCDEIGIDFLSSPFDRESVSFLDSLDVKYIKIGSGELTNTLLLKSVNKTKRCVLLSTGMSTMSEIEIALEYLSDCKVVILHCTSAYPTPYEEVNLNVIETLVNTFNRPMGFSDHTIDYFASLGAVAKGVKYIEKHFTYDNDAEGPDHQASLNPVKFAEFVEKIRLMELLLGTNIKNITDSEVNTKKVARKSLILTQFTKKGTIITEDILEAKRPSSGISPIYLDKVIGRKIKNDLMENHILGWDDFE